MKTMPPILFTIGNVYLHSAYVQNIGVSSGRCFMVDAAIYVPVESSIAQAAAGKVWLAS